MDADSFDRLTRLPRRDFLRLMSMGGAAAAVRFSSDAAPLAPPLPVAGRSPWPIFRLARPEDHLCVEIELVNLQVIAETGERAQSRRIHVASHGENGYIVLRFPGQHFAEQALWDRGAQIPGDQRAEDRTGDPPAPVTYPLWRQKAWRETAPNTEGKREDALSFLDEKRNDDLAFLLLGPWRVPKPAPPDYPEARRLGQELDRQRRARRAFPQAWEVWADKDKPAPWGEGPITGRGQWNHSGWTQGMAGLWVSGPSQLVFEVPQWRAPFPCDADTILRLCTRLDLVVMPQLDPAFDQPQDDRQAERLEPPLPGALAGHHPGAPPPITSIEFPTLLYLSPYANARWRLRPTVAGGAAELWALELERPKTGSPAPGTPRQRREAGHLFAFGRRAVEEARWPQDIDGAPPLDEAKAGKVKYADFESPKTTLYDATRRLLVLQLREDNGDITAEHLSLTALGASADLRYRPLLEPQGDKPVAEVQPEVPLKPKAGEGSAPPLPPSRIPRKDPKDKGFLTEWIQKTELGRDYYSKEAFAGWWMPWGFKAESVTITERLPCIDPWLEFRQGGARLRPRDVLREAGLNLTEAEFLDLEGHEPYLLAFLVARKFARVKPRFPKAGLVREFGAGESEDFLGDFAMAARSVGLRKVEVLVERTPVLANHYCSVPEGEFNKYIQDGLDLRVAGGTGKDAGREIFLPRVREFARDAEGRLSGRLVPYRFPMRFTYRDGRTETVEMPMLFVPTLVLGQELYPLLPEDLRAPVVQSKIAFVELPAPGAVNTVDIGPAADLEAAGRHLEEILPGTIAAKLATGGALARSGSLSLVADGINAFIDGPGAATMRLLSSPDLGKALGEALKKIVPDENEKLADLATRWESGLVISLQSTMTGLDRAAEEAREIATSAQRFYAWGVEEIVEIDHLFAAQRLERLLRFPDNAKLDAKWVESIKKALDAIGAAANLPQAKAKEEAWEKLRKVLEDPVFKGRSDHLAAAAEAAVARAKASALDAVNEYNAALREFLVQWAAQLGGVWRRHHWDAVFHYIARGFDPGLELERRILTATYKKRLQLRFLNWEGSGKITLKFGAENLTLDLTGVVLQPPGQVTEVRRKVAAWLDEARNAVERDPAVLERVLRGVEDALVDERGLRQRLHRAVEDLSAKGHPAVRQELETLFHDVATHVTAMLAHARDGRERFERLVRRVEPTPELVAQWREEVLIGYRGLQAEVRQGLSKLPAVKEVTQAKQTIERLLVTTNPERLRQKLEDVVDLTGRRIRAALRAQVDQLYQAGEGLFEKLDALARGAEADAGHAGEEVIRELESLFQLTEKVADEFRDTLETLFEKERTRVANNLAAFEGRLPDGSSARRWVGAARQLAERRLQSWRLGQAAVLLSEDLLRGVENVRTESTRELAGLRRQLLAALADDLAIPRDLYAKAVGELERVASAAGDAYRDRARALKRWTEEQGSVPELVGYALAALLAVRRQAEGLMDELLGNLLGDLAQSALLAQLKSGFPEVADTVADLRRLVGEVEDIKKAVGQLRGPNAAEAERLWRKLQNQAQAMATAMQADLQHSLELVEGKSFNLTKRALASLPAPAMLRDFQDQTHKAIFQASRLVFSAAPSGIGLAEQLALPKLEAFHIKVPGLDERQIVRFSKAYVDNGLRDFNQAKGAVFGELQRAASTVAQSAGLVEAREKIQELSRELGGVAKEVKDQLGEARTKANSYVDALRGKTEEALRAELDKIKKEADVFKASVKDLLPPEIPKLLGSLPLDKVLGVVSDPSSLPQMIANELPDRLERCRTWVKATEEVDIGIVRFEPKPGCQFRLDARATVYRPQPGRGLLPPSHSVRGQLGAFDVTVQDLLVIHFSSLSFTAENGAVKCVPKLGQAELRDVTDIIEFKGALRFLEDMRKTLGRFLAESPFRLQVRDDYIFATLALAVPTLGFGAVSITGLSFRAGLGLPLGSGPLIFRFALSDRLETFKVSVGGFAGGGFFALELSTDPTQSLVEGAFEFGGAISLSLAVVQGEISAMGGIYFRRSRAYTVLEAYFRVCGRVTVFGFIEIGILIMLALRYRNEAGASSLFGVVTVRIRVKVGFFSKSFSFAYQKTFAGSRGASSDRGGSARAVRPRRRREPIERIGRLAVALGGVALAGTPDLARIGRSIPAERKPADPPTTVTPPPGPTRWRWGQEPWPTASDFGRPLFAGPPRFSETMTPGDWGSYWRLYDWRNLRRRSDGRPPKPGAPAPCDQRDLETPARP